MKPNADVFGELFSNDIAGRESGDVEVEKAKMTREGKRRND
jgi:hypothetical protein